jgi:hypothetical protein
MFKYLFKTPFNSFKHHPHPWLLIDVMGNYIYRSPDSHFEHEICHFESKEAALEYLDEQISKAEQPSWRLYALDETLLSGNGTRSQTATLSSPKEKGK